MNIPQNDNYGGLKKNNNKFIQSPWHSSDALKSPCQKPSETIKLLSCVALDCNTTVSFNRLVYMNFLRTQNFTNLRKDIKL
jgi:hypothetical protein